MVATPPLPDGPARALDSLQGFVSVRRPGTVLFLRLDNALGRNDHLRTLVCDGITAGKSGWRHWFEPDGERCRGAHLQGRWRLTCWRLFGRENRAGQAHSLPDRQLRSNLPRAWPTPPTDRLHRADLECRLVDGKVDILSDVPLGPALLAGDAIGHRHEPSLRDKPPRRSNKGNSIVSRKHLPTAIRWGERASPSFDP